MSLISTGSCSFGSQYMLCMLQLEERHELLCNFCRGEDISSAMDAQLSVLVVGRGRGEKNVLGPAFSRDYLHCDVSPCGKCTRRNALCPAVTILKFSSACTVQTDQRTTVNQHSAARKNKSINNGTHIGYNSSSLRDL
jgi:hypothetical protein